MRSKEEHLLDRIREKFDIDGNIQRKRRIWIKIDKDELLELCGCLKKKGFIHLSAISVTDWPDDNVFEVTYHIWSYDDKILITLKAKLDRENPTIESVTNIWQENAQIHERELHELFGVEFENNTDLEPLFLEDWSGPPPFRKDFNWREYVQDEFYDKENERERVYFY